MIDSIQLKDIYAKIREVHRISPNEALYLLKNAPWLEIAQLAAECRNRQVGSESASYTVFRIINYTNVCTISCSFCSFKCQESDKQAYVLNKAEIFQKIDLSIQKEADQIFLQGGVHPNLKLNYYTDLLKSIKSKYNIHIRGFSPVEIKHFSLLNHIPIPQVISELKKAGLDSVPGAGAEILVERVRKILSPQKCSVSEWAGIMEECHKQGLPGSANIVFGSIETDEDIIEHLDLVRKIQDQTAGFNSFIPWTFQAQTDRFQVKKIPSQKYLKLLGLCRIFLDNIKNIEVSVLVLGTEIGKIALHMGANDISSPVIEENVLESHGVKTEEEARLLISDAGFKPQRRNFNYQYVNSGEF